MSKMTKSDAARIQGAGAVKNGGKTQKGSFPARAQAAGDKNANNGSANQKK